MKILVSLFVLVLAAFALNAAGADFAGKWSGTLTVTQPEGANGGDAFCILKQNGNEITGSAGPDESQQWPLSKIKVDGNKLTGEVQNPNGLIYKVTLVLEGDTLKGDVDATAPSGENMKGKLVLNRVK